MNAPAKYDIPLDVLALRGLAFAADRGLTVKECRDLIEDHHGSMSGTLSNLHYEERAALLAERRDGCHVYVLPQYVDGRETVEHRGLTTTKEDRARVRRVMAVVEEYMVPLDVTATGISTQSKGERWPQLFANKVRRAWGEIE